MLSLPPRTEVPSLEPWLFAEGADAEGVAAAARKKAVQRERETGKRAKVVQRPKVWSKKKVFGDIINHTAKEFPPADQDQWAALQNFHDVHPTSDSVPTVPFQCSASGSSTQWPCDLGMPVDWAAA